MRNAPMWLGYFLLLLALFDPGDASSKWAAFLAGNIWLAAWWVTVKSKDHGDA